MCLNLLGGGGVLRYQANETTSSSLEETYDPHPPFLSNKHPKSFRVVLRLSNVARDSFGVVVDEKRRTKTLHEQLSLRRHTTAVLAEIIYI